MNDHGPTGGGEEVNGISMTVPTDHPYIEERDGGLRVKGTRVSLDSIVYGFLDGRSPEEIADSFRSVTLEQVYGTIAYYLGHKEEIDSYLKEGEALAEALHRRSREENRPLLERVLAARARTVSRV